MSLSSFLPSHSVLSLGKSSIDDTYGSGKNAAMLPESHNHVDVQSAERNFADLCRQLTQASSNYLSEGRAEDKEAGDGGQAFDLLNYLRGTEEAREEQGFYHKELGVIFENLSVTGAGGLRLNIRTFAVVLRELVLAPVMPYLKKRFGPPPKCILHPMSGSLKPGEMCLVLGRPGSGCTTFLKVIANQRQGYQKIDGEVLYSGISAQVMADQFKGEVVYNPETDFHHPTLTVGQTIKFALSTKAPSKLLPNETKKIFIDKVMNVFLQMLGIMHTKDTMVGDAVIRGVSGGERKRVSIAEMMATRACVLSWDNSTRGLDASTALDYARALRIFTNVLQTTMFVTLYQAGEGIYNQFDKVMLLNEGRMVYYGPVDEARAYLMSLGYKNLPRQTTADYLTGCTDPNERQFADGFDVSRIPKTADEMEQAFRRSHMFQRMEAERIAYKKSCTRERKNQLEFMAAVREDKSRATRAQSPYTVSLFAQLQALILRQIQILIQDRQGRIFEWMSAISLSIITGSVFFRLPVTSEGAFTREGVLFVAMLFNVFIALTELPRQMIGRPIMWRQTAFCFYRPGAIAIANALAEIPFSLPKIFVFSLTIFFMTGLYSSAGAFFLFYALIYLGYFALSCFFRLMGAISFNFDTASRLASVLVITMSLYCGYEIPKRSIPRGLQWVFYINPLSYSFSALMGNEFGRLSLACDESWIVPRGDGYPSGLGPHQACTLAGSMPGQASTDGETYIRALYGYTRHHIWRNIGILAAYIVFFMGLLFLAVEKLSVGGRADINVFQKENAERKLLNEKLQENKQTRIAGSAAQDLSGLIRTRLPFTWESLTYDVPVAGGQKRLLNAIDGYVVPGTLTALMGASGAGKTTLLDVLANRKTTGTVGGTICIGGHSPGVGFQRGTAYCEQQDMHEWTATVREALRFSAHLRQPASVSLEEKNAYVEEIIQLLEMEDLADAMIGIPGYGLGVEARKRVTIGVELAAKPQLLLFLDEPTSGLDGQSAYNIVRYLRKLSLAGQAILCTIHQPNALLFENFDRLLLLKKGGKCVYFGDIGQDSAALRSYLERNGARCPEDANPAEFMLEAIGAGSSEQAMGGPQDWADRWLESPEHAANLAQIQKLKEQSVNLDESSQLDSAETVYAASIWVQLQAVLRRTNTSFWRNADYEVTRLFNHTTVGLAIGLTFLNLDDSLSSMRNRTFTIFQGIIIPMLILSHIQPVFLHSRAIYNREASSKMYAPVIFAFSQFAAELPYCVICAVMYFITWYIPAGLQRDASRSGYAFLMVLMLELYSVTAGQAVAALSPSLFIAHQANPALVVFMLLFCGVPRPRPQIPSFWREWMYNLNPLTRFISGLLANEAHGLVINCQEEEFVPFFPPSGQTCGQWANAFVNATKGYLRDPASRTLCQYCPYRIGDEYLESYQISYDLKWREWGIFTTFVVFNVAVTLLAASFLTARYAKR